ncbi:PDGLE domain-containing protein [Saccharopolyspora erythraea]|uniref:PDGLE domain-containing protein n=1 Tax=Saccharopolyspora erythraea TaxID=1836 RepID=UPI001BA7685B|nr:PDGLE domain-containing protein [Saccharopolyspora erythraea]QUH02740.1 PDGLE domain-containing protein [Saccharopolyspora erythraea]
MTAVARKRGAGFLVGFGLVALLIAAALSYFADSDPDGLDAVTRQGCTAVETEQGERLDGHCIAQNGTDHPLADGPLADYTVGGDDRLTGVAGAIGVVATLGAAGALFWGLRRRGTGGQGEAGDTPGED